MNQPFGTAVAILNLRQGLALALLLLATLSTPGWAAPVSYTLTFGKSTVEEELTDSFSFNTNYLAAPATLFDGQALTNTRPTGVWTVVEDLDASPGWVLDSIDVVITGENNSYEYIFSEAVRVGVAVNFSDSSGGSATITFNNSPVPIPAAAWLFGSALLGLAAVKRKKA